MDLVDLFVHTIAFVFLRSAVNENGGLFLP